MFVIKHRQKDKRARKGVERETLRRRDRKKKGKKEREEEKKVERRKRDVQLQRGKTGETITETCGCKS